MPFSHLTGLAYFIYFVTGMLLLYGLTYALSMRLKYYLSEARVEKFLLGKSGMRGNILAAFFGAITPFCSCTTVPIFSGMLESNIRTGYAMSFLIASPTINPPALILIWTFFGWEITLYYTAAVFIAAVLGGLVLGQKRLSGYVHEVFLFTEDPGKLKWKELLKGYLQFLRGFILIILLAAVIATFLKSWTPPEGFILGILSRDYLAVPIGVGIGLFLYSDLILIIPIASALVLKGIDHGTVFAFVMAASGIGLPSLLLLSKLVHRKLLLYYVLLMCLLLIALGYILNLII